MGIDDDFAEFVGARYESLYRLAYLLTGSPTGARTTASMSTERAAAWASTLPRHWPARPAAATKPPWPRPAPPKPSPSSSRSSPQSTVLQAPTPEQSFGHNALHLRLRIDQQCPPGESYIVAVTPRGTHGITYGHNPIDMDFWVMDPNGTPVVVDSWYPQGSSSDLVERVDETRKSIFFVDSE
jgi:hypothetical protein